MAKKPSKPRESGIELLKILAVFIIVLAHMAQGLSMGTDFDFYLDLNRSSLNWSNLILKLLRYLGALGNDIFFISSAWFLVDKKEHSLKKIVYLEADIWFISTAMLCIFLVSSTVPVSKTEIINSLFPTMTNSYWYTTCYIVFYLLYPWINLFIHAMTKRQLWRTTCVLFMVYIVMQTFMDFLGVSLFFSNRLVTFIALYFVIAYQKQYCDEITISWWINILALSTVGWIAFEIGLNAIGMKVSLLSSFISCDKNHNVFLTVMAISLFGIARQIRFKNSAVNYLSSLSLLIYLIHGNMLVIRYIRPYLWHLFYAEFGHQYDILGSFCLAVFFFVVSALCGSIYKLLVQPIVHRICEELYNKSVKLENL